MKRNFDCVVTSTWVRCDTQPDFNTCQGGRWCARKQIDYIVGPSVSDMRHVVSDQRMVEGMGPFSSVIKFEGRELKQMESVGKGGCDEHRTRRMRR